MQLELTIVNRDRLWFQKYLPLFQKFISDLEQFRNSYDSYISEILPHEVKKSPKKRKLSESCLVGNYDDLKNKDISKDVVEIQ